MRATDFDERDAQGNLTAWALACDALQDHGCDCGVDEPGTCLACRCEAAMRAERAQKDEHFEKLSELTTLAFQHDAMYDFDPDTHEGHFDLYDYLHGTLLALKGEREAVDHHEAELTRLLALLRLTVDGGKIVSSAALSPEAITMAAACNRMYVDADGLGFVYVPEPSGNPGELEVDDDQR